MMPPLYSYPNVLNPEFPQSFPTKYFQIKGKTAKFARNNFHN